MASRKGIESCIFCEASPCTCASVAPKKPRLPPKKNIQQAVTITAPVLQERSGLVAANIAKPVDPEVELERHALTILCQSGLISWQDVSSLRDKLNLTTLEVRILVWRLKREQSLTSIQWTKNGSS